MDLNNLKDHDDLFVAFGEHGDNFFVRRGEKQFVVDAGSSARTKHLEKVMQGDTLDFCACTHNDGDHAKGILSIVKKGLTDEVWLPARWAWRLQALLEDRDDFFDELKRNLTDERVVVRHLPYLIGDRPDLIADHLDQEYQGRNDHADQALEEGDWYNRDDLEQVAEEMKEIFRQRKDDIREQASSRLMFEPQHFYLETERALRMLAGEWGNSNLSLRIVESVFSDAERIGKIYDAAESREDVSERWFRFNPYEAKGGEENLLVPINACELDATEARDWISALDYLSYCGKNEQSLAFYTSGEGHSGASVLFTADSHLGFIQQIQVEDEMPITAPHHGSASNGDAFDRILTALDRAESESQKWVRSDNKHVRGNVAQKYYDLSQESRFCVRCQGDDSSRNIVFYGQDDQWEPVDARYRCTCNQ